MPNRVIKKLNSDNERGARRQLIEELFYDFNKSKIDIYWVNFTRGIFFGLGSVLGGTVLIALLVWALGWFVTIPVIGEYIKHIVLAIQHAK
jgi:hypothetical protein